MSLPHGGEDKASRKYTVLGNGVGGTLCMVLGTGSCGSWLTELENDLLWEFTVRNFTTEKICSKITSI